MALLLPDACSVFRSPPNSWSTFLSTMEKLTSSGLLLTVPSSLCFPYPTTFSLLWTPSHQPVRGISGETARVLVLFVRYTVRNRRTAQTRCPWWKKTSGSAVEKSEHNSGPSAGKSSASKTRRCYIVTPEPKTFVVVDEASC